MTIRFEVPGKAVGKQRPKAVRRGSFISMYTPKETQSYENLVKHMAHIAMEGRPLIEDACTVAMTIECQVPESWSGKKKAQALCGNIRPTTKPDVDNVIKAIFDACNGIVWKDDVQVVELALRKRYSATPRVCVSIGKLVQDCSEVAA